MSAHSFVDFAREEEKELQFNSTPSPIHIDANIQTSGSATDGTALDLKELDGYLTEENEESADRAYSERKKGFYERHLKRPMDFILSLIGLVILSPILLLIAILVRIKLGSPVIFKQERPGLNEKIFTLYKFRTMTDARDEEGNLLPDSQRLTGFGKTLRSTSLDELPELLNILKGDMSVVGPRPLLVKDMVFMSDHQRKRHLVSPGLTGLAQIKGRNLIDWEKKLQYDITYIRNMTFLSDLKVMFLTFLSVLKRKGITGSGMDTAEDLGDYLLRTGQIDINHYNYKMLELNQYKKD